MRMTKVALDLLEEGRCEISGRIEEKKDGSKKGRTRGLQDPNGHRWLWKECLAPTARKGPLRPRGPQGWNQTGLDLSRDRGFCEYDETAIGSVHDGFDLP